MNRILGILPLAALVAVSCESNPHETAQFHAIDADGWAYGDTLSFRSECADSIFNGRLALAIRHTNAYVYSNLWLEVTSPQDSTNSVDTINVQLSDAFGRWYGHGSGVSYVVTDTLPGRYTIPVDKPVSVRHIMRVDTLNDLEQIGIIFIENTL
jgi:gliding motility-associated lipoprotein GldH